MTAVTYGLAIAGHDYVTSTGDSVTIDRVTHRTATTVSVIEHRPNSEAHAAIHHCQEVLRRIC